MQQPISSQDFVRKTFEKPVAFNCVVKGKPLVAEVVAELDSLEYGFAVKFSDGSAFEASLLESGKWWIDDVKKRDYIKAISDDLESFISVKHNEWDTVELNYKNNPLRVWVSKTDSDEGEHYSIYYNGDYRFHLRKVGKGWEARSIRVRNPDVIDDDLASWISIWLETAA